MSKNCNHQTCQDEFCRRPPQPKKMPAPIKKVSDKMKLQLCVYTPLAKKFREEHPSCQIHGPGCTGKTECVHHTKGRIGELLTDTKYWMAACYPCNLWVETNDLEAREGGFKISKFKQEVK